MITEKQKSAIIQVLGYRYSPIIEKHLSKKGLLNAHGKPYNQEAIQKIVRGDRPNIAIEKEIAKLVASEKRKQQKAQQTTKKLLK